MLKLYLKKLKMDDDVIELNFGKGWCRYYLSDIRDVGIVIPDDCKNFEEFRIKAGPHQVLNISVYKSIKVVDVTAINSVYPVGCAYTQYPLTEDPNDLFPFTRWEVINFNGAFFRAEGGNANEFAKDEDNLELQSQGTATNGLSVLNNPNGDIKGINVTTKMSGNSSGSVRCGSEGLFNGRGDMHTSGCFSLSDFSRTYCGGDNGDSGRPSTLNINVQHTHNVYLHSSDQETRPINYTIRIWKRVE